MRNRAFELLETPPESAISTPLLPTGNYHGGVVTDTEYEYIPRPWRQGESEDNIDREKYITSPNMSKTLDT